jgi:AcrR family transcriptional regulator
MKKMKSYHLWITAGYEVFSKEGPAGIMIERLAHILNLNKSGFYYYFGSLETYFEHLMLYHGQQSEEFVAQAKSMKNFLPDYIQFMSDYQLPVMVQRQLSRSRHIPVFGKMYEEVHRKVDPVILPLWADFIETNDDPALALQYLDLYRESFYARVTPDMLSFEFMCDLSLEAKDICQRFRNSYQHMLVASKTA